MLPDVTERCRGYSSWTLKKSSWLWNGLWANSGLSLFCDKDISRGSGSIRVIMSTKCLLYTKHCAECFTRIHI